MADLKISWSDGVRWCKWFELFNKQADRLHRHHVLHHLQLWLLSGCCHRLWSHQFKEDLWMGNQSLQHTGRLCKAQPKQATLSPQTWACLAAGSRRQQSDVCQLSWSVPTVHTLQRPEPHALTLSTLALFEFDGWGGETHPSANEKSSARQYIYTS